MTALAIGMNSNRPAQKFRRSPGRMSSGSRAAISPPKTGPWRFIREKGRPKRPAVGHRLARRKDPGTGLRRSPTTFLNEGWPARGAGFIERLRGAAAATLSSLKYLKAQGAGLLARTPPVAGSPPRFHGAFRPPWL